MYDRQRILALLDGSTRGHTLLRALYRDQDVFEFDVERVFTRSWLLIGFEVELPEPGSHLALTIGTNPILVVRGRDGEIRGFHNTCRHRGSQICPDGRGRSGKLVCPYHKWTYDLNGRLIGAARMGPTFRVDDIALKPISVRLLAGCIYVALTPEAPDFSPFEAAAGPVLRKYRLHDAKLAHESVIVERANWKLAMENARECYHCASGHPELRHTFPVAIGKDFSFAESEHTTRYFEQLAALGLPTKPKEGSWWQTGFYPLNPGIESISMDGQPVVKRRLIDSEETGLGGFRWATEPNSFGHALADYAFMFAAIPVGPEETRIVSKWFVPKGAVEGVDYHIADLIETWTKTNAQDRELAENNQRGVNSIGYTPGPYSMEAEDYAARFAEWYRAEARAAASTPAGSMLPAG
ncbi:MAG: aromatic ring-hydroxylating dioxygenase subunit alpha [Steroidobacteraceae bacterium]|jgi:Rieske 2Fe-2S family protein